MVMVNSKMYGNDELHIPKIIKKNFKPFELDENTIFEWTIQDDKIILKPRKKIELEDVVGIISDDSDEEFDIDTLVYLNE